MGVFKDFFGFEVPTRFIIFMWTLGISVMLGLSIHDLCPIFRDYFDVNSNVNVMIDKIEKDQMKAPNLYICLPTSGSQFLSQLIDYEQDAHPHVLNGTTRNSSCPMCSGLRWHGWDVWSNLHFSGGHENETLQNELHLAFLRKIFKNLAEMDDILSVNNSDWNQPIVESIMKFMERIQFNDLVTMNVGYSSFERNYLDGFIVDRSNQEIDTLYDQLLRHKANLQYVPGSDSDYFSQGISLYIQPGGDGYCFRMNITEGFFVVEAKQIFFKYALKWDAFYIYTQNPLSSTILPTPLYKSNKDEEDIGSAPKETVKLLYNIQSSVRELRDGKHCYQQDSKGACVKECQAKKVIQLCSCLPFITKRLSTQSDLISQHNSTYCTIYDYEKCNEYDQSMADKCNEKCAVACEYEFYQWQITREKSKEDLELWVDVAASVAPYLQFTLDVKDYQANLISQVGGIFNFYLGWSGLSLFACVIFLLECYARWRDCKPDTPEHGQVHQPQTTLHMVKMASLTGQTVSQVQERESESDLHKEVDMLKKLVKELTAKMEEMETRWTLYLGRNSS